MTGEEIRQLAELHTEDLPIEEETALKYINECIIMDLGKDARVIRNQIVTVNKDEWVELEKPFLAIFEIEKGDSPIPYMGRKYSVSHEGSFDIRDKMIRFPKAGTFTIWGYVMPSVFTDLSREPEVHELFHYPIAIYVASRAIFWDDEENPAAQLKMNEYFLHRARTIAQLSETGPTTGRSRTVKHRPFV